MTNAMTPEFYYAVLTAAFTSLLWAPHVAQRLLEMGLVGGFRDPLHDAPTQAPWAQRSIRAHGNAVENLAVFGLLATAIQITGHTTSASAAAAAVYFAVRIAHYLIYVIGLPWARAPMFLIGWACQWVLIAALFGWVK
ncbi:MAPEG family protein [Methylocystis sp. MJC1]|jgi:uncharacterized MAPEG superfamily protein|uniref:MAPEG family protein n=1 Tax=Methylocystis sp. MJC1 TaxID=2654282 RepID=UPI0013EC53D7|nr:MAPEG family protein [Methylocystis sp. MJC1]KAF2992668.1 hypothetical protein MJC1_00246 [Methylocystis sp. MJC1]MBU6526633.1 MAPEG family protein [Methylocystis sp. MJC1]UZX13075.1 MAPEG family protein [Methylocystis sp. MJC1]